MDFEFPPTPPKSAPKQRKSRLITPPRVFISTREDAVEVLKKFDLDYRYGPCLGITRLQRYERAVKLNIHPLPEVDIKSLIEKFSRGPDDDEIVQCLWFREGIMST